MKNICSLPDFLYFGLFGTLKGFRSLDRMQYKTKGTWVNTFKNYEFIYLMKKVIKHSYYSCEKVIPPLIEITGCTTFSRNNCSQMLPIIWYCTWWYCSSTEYGNYMHHEDNNNLNSHFLTHLYFKAGPSLQYFVNIQQSAQAKMSKPTSNGVQ